MFINLNLHCHGGNQEKSLVKKILKPITILF